MALLRLVSSMILRDVVDDGGLVVAVRDRDRVRDCIVRVRGRTHRGRVHRCDGCIRLGVLHVGIRHGFLRSCLARPSTRQR